MKYHHPKPLSHKLKLQHVFHRPLSLNRPFLERLKEPPRSPSSERVFQLHPEHVSSLSWTNSSITTESQSPFFELQSYRLLAPANKRTALEYLAPDIYDKLTVLTLAHMAASSYILPSNPEWVPIDGYKSNLSFGWNDDGLRGYIYTTEHEDLVIVAIKGTTASFLGIGGETAPNDKTNDNHMFSCCCAHVDFTWKPTCSCFSPGRQCDKTCLRNNSNYESSYYQASLDLYHAVWKAYPKSMVWFTGHSLGGALSALLALTYTRPAVTFQAPGEKHFAGLLGLPIQNTLPLYHLGHDVDPIFLGHCQGLSSPCYHAGYAIETSCHVGHTCLYRASHHGYKEDIRHHRIFEVIDILTELNNVPECRVDHACLDCAQWNYY